MIASRQGDLSVIVARFDSLAWLLPTTANLPKNIRFTHVNRIDNLALDFVDDLVEAQTPVPDRADRYRLG